MLEFFNEINKKSYLFKNINLGILLNLFRGMRNFEGNEKIIKTRKYRKPLHTPEHIHKEADAIFENKFGIKFRSQSVFCTSDIDVASAYGDIVVRVEPIGDYKVCWSPTCSDFTDIMNTNMNVSQFIINHKYQVGDVLSAIDSKNEIMLYCESYKVIKL